MLTPAVLAYGTAGVVVLLLVLFVALAVLVVDLARFMRSSGRRSTADAQKVATATRRHLRPPAPRGRHRAPTPRPL